MTTNALTMVRRNVDKEHDIRVTSFLSVTERDECSKYLNSDWCSPTTNHDKRDVHPQKIFIFRTLFLSSYTLRYLVTTIQTNSEKCFISIFCDQRNNHL